MSMKRFCSRQLLSQIEVVAHRSFRRALDCEASTTMRRFPVAAGTTHSQKTLVKPVRVEGRRKNSTGVSNPLGLKNEKNGALGSAVSLRNGSSALQKAKTELRIVPGVGPRNEELLCSIGIENVESLRSVFKERFELNDTLFVKYLQEEVGIMHRHHCQSIAKFLNKEGRRRARSNDRITISLEGNISVGKSTLLSWLADERLELRDLCEVVQEPIEEWTSVGGSKENNLLERYYKDPKKHAYEFQNYVFFTRFNANRTTFEGEKPLRLMERSVFSDRLVFVRAVHEAQHMDDFQLQLYDSWFNPMLNEAPGLIPDGFIYLRANPETCIKRLKRRARSEEKSVSEAYIEGLHSKHEDWFKKEEWTENKSILFPGKPCVHRIDIHTDPLTGEVQVPEEIKDCVIWLGKNGILSREPTSERGLFVPDVVKEAMSETPALILDCDEDINVESDLEAKRHYAKKVKTYFEFVKHHKEEARKHRELRKSLNGATNGAAEPRFWRTDRGENLRLIRHLADTYSEEQIRQLVRQN